MKKLRPQPWLRTFTSTCCMLSKWPIGTHGIQYSHSKKPVTKFPYQLSTSRYRGHVLMLTKKPFHLGEMGLGVQFYIDAVGPVNGASLNSSRSPLSLDYGPGPTNWPRFHMACVRFGQRYTPLAGLLSRKFVGLLPDKRLGCMSNCVNSGLT